MSEAAPGAAPQALSDAPPDVDAVLASLRHDGAHRMDPTGFHYLEVLARRTRTYQGPVQRLLEGKLALALADLRARFHHAQNDAQDTMAQCLRRHPQAADDLQRLFADGDFKGVYHLAAKLQRSTPGTSLGDLSRHLAQHAAEHGQSLQDGPGASRPELKSVRQFRNTWSKLSVDKQVARALDQAPKNAGPINSHMLVLRSLTAMRDISPDYLNRFTSYVDTLLCLDAFEAQSKPVPKKPPAPKAAKK